MKAPDTSTYIGLLFVGASLALLTLLENNAEWHRFYGAGNLLGLGIGMLIYGGKE